MDDDGSKCLDFQEFEKGLENYAVSVGKDKARQIFATMDKDGSGTINFDEFLEKLRVRIRFEDTEGVRVNFNATCFFCFCASASHVERTETGDRSGFSEV